MTAYEKELVERYSNVGKDKVDWLYDIEEDKKPILANIYESFSLQILEDNDISADLLVMSYPIIRKTFLSVDFSKNIDHFIQRLKYYDREIIARPSEHGENEDVEKAVEIIDHLIEDMISFELNT